MADKDDLLPFLYNNHKNGASITHKHILSQKSSNALICVAPYYKFDIILKNNNIISREEIGEDCKEYVYTYIFKANDTICLAVLLQMVGLWVGLIVGKLCHTSHLLIFNSIKSVFKFKRKQCVEFGTKGTSADRVNRKRKGKTLSGQKQCALLVPSMATSLIEN